MNFFHHKVLGNHLLQLCPKVVKHPVLMMHGPMNIKKKTIFPNLEVVEVFCHIGYINVAYLAKVSVTACDKPCFLCHYT